MAHAQRRVPTSMSRDHWVYHRWENLEYPNPSSPSSRRTDLRIADVARRHPVPAHLLVLHSRRQGQHLSPPPPPHSPAALICFGIHAARGCMPHTPACMPFICGMHILVPHRVTSRPSLGTGSVQTVSSLVTEWAAYFACLHAASMLMEQRARCAAWMYMSRHMWHDTTLSQVSPPLLENQNYLKNCVKYIEDAAGSIAGERRSSEIISSSMKGCSLHHHQRQQPAPTSKTAACTIH